MSRSSPQYEAGAQGKERAVIVRGVQGENYWQLRAFCEPLRMRHMPGTAVAFLSAPTD